MINLFLFVLFGVALCKEMDIDHLQPVGVKENSDPDLELDNPELLNLDDEVMFSNIKMESMSNSDHERKLQLSNSLHPYESDITFSVLNTLKMRTEAFNNRSLNNPNTTNNSSDGKNQTVTKYECLLRNVSDDEIPSVAVTNSSILLKVLTPVITNATAGDCAVILFFSSQCVFSARMAPHFNALPRVFPGVAFYALDTLVHNNVHMRFGVVAVPIILLFHNGKAVARYNETYLNLENFVNFVVKNTGLKHYGTLNVTSADLLGPVPAALILKVDYVLILAWAFTCFCIGLWFVKSALCHKIVETVKNTWQEAEAQHEHTE